MVAGRVILGITSSVEDSFPASLLALFGVAAHSFAIILHAFTIRFS
jgi:hypothetical protein